MPSGRYQARYRVDGVERRAPETFATARAAHAFLAATRTQLERGVGVASDSTLAEYAARWMSERPLLRERSRELYEGLLRLHVLPTLGAIPLRDIKPAVVRSWHASLLSGPRPGASTAAKSYRLLRGILATAVDDELIEKHPCRIRGVGVEHPKERPIATIEEVYEIADAIEPRYCALMLTATFTGLRLGELRALTCRNLDLLHATVHVTGQLQELKDGSLAVVPPKTAAGVRTVSVPQVLIPELEEHLARWSARGSDGWVFTGTKDQPFRRGSMYGAWRRARGRRRGPALPRSAPHWSELAAGTGATTKELMARLGHASSRVALIYQHATQDRDQAIAQALSNAVTRATDANLVDVVALGAGSGVRNDDDW